MIRNKLRRIFWRVFPQNSKMDRLVRPIYHSYFTSGRYVSRQLDSARESFTKWNDDQNDFLTSLPIVTSNIKQVTFFMDVRGNEIHESLKTIKSIQAQTNDQWMLIVLASNHQEVNPIEELQRIDARRIHIIRNNEPSLLKLIEHSGGDYFTVAQPGDSFSHHFINAFLSFEKNNHPVDIYYYHSTLHSATNGKVRYPYFKPKTASPNLIHSSHYLSRSLFSREVVNQVENSELVSGPLYDQEQQLIGYLLDLKITSVLIPLFLIDQIMTEENPDSQFKLQKKAETNSSFSTMVKSNASLNSEAEVSIIIPTNGNSLLINRLLRSIIKFTGPSGYEIIIVNNGEDLKLADDILNVLNPGRALRIIKFLEPFNYSRVINRGAGQAKGNMLLFLNDDIEVIHHGWLEKLIFEVQNPGTALVGVKLLFPNFRIQHAGIILGMQGIGGHLYQQAPRHYFGLAGSADWKRDVIAVTGACQIIRRDVFSELEGYDEAFQLTFSDIDICLRARKKGYQVIYDPSVELIHHQGRSRGYFTPEQDILVARQRFADELAKGDPYFNDALVVKPIPGCKPFNPVSLNL